MRLLLLPATCAPMCDATRRTVRTRQGYWRPIDARRSMRSRSSRRNSKVCKALHRIREQWKAQRTATINLMRGVLREFGVVIPLGAAKVRPAVPSALLEDGENDLPMVLRRDTLSEMLDRLTELTRAMNAIEQQLQAYADADPVCQRSPSRRRGLAMLTATALRASCGPLDRFPVAGRHFAAWMGLARREHSSGNQRHLGRISETRRWLLTHAADSRRARNIARSTCSRAAPAIRRSTDYKPGR